MINPGSHLHEPIALIGIGCRFPGGGDSPASFWRLLQNGVDAITEIPDDRPELRKLYDKTPNAPGKIITPRGGFLSGLDKFDAHFFEIAPREARCLDPQQRLLLETAWEAFEDAGIAPRAWAGRRGGVFLGMWTNEYEDRMQDATNHFDLYITNGGGRHSASGRLNYFFDLQGPSMTLDTACSSSLVAVHLACQSLRSHESDLALAGGVNLMLKPYISVGYSRSKMLAPDGLCKFGDASANGYVRSEGCGIILLKRLSDALAARDPIYALIRGSAVNNDGQSSGLLVAPGVQTQHDMLLAAYRNAGVAPQLVQYIEAHGTGTAVGDPVELEALSRVLSVNRAQEQPCWIGSVKTNLGHAEAASGIAGLIKLALCLKERALPPSLHCNHPNPKIKWEEWQFKVPQHFMPWPMSDAPLYAGVNSFGVTGTNAHIVMEGWTQTRSTLGLAEGSCDENENLSRAKHATAEPLREQRQNLLCLSAKTENALRDLATKFEKHLAGDNSSALRDTCYSATATRAHFAHRVALVAASHEEMRAQLAAFANGSNAAHVTHAHAKNTTLPKLAFLFTGQGAQYCNMGRALYETQPVFRAAVQRCDEILRPHLDRSLLSVLFNDDSTPSSNSVILEGTSLELGAMPSAREVSSRMTSQVESGHNPSMQNTDHRSLITDYWPLNIEHLLHQTCYTQPALFSIEYALAELWRSWGIEPSMLLGHSVGEYVAACVAGVFSLEDGLKLIAARGRLMQALPRGGVMAAVFVDKEKAEQILAPFAEHVAIAAYNGPENIVISGREQEVQSVLAKLHADGIKTKALVVSHAFHSPLMAPMLDAFERIASEITFHAPRLPLLSNLTGRVFAEGEIPDAKYWREHVRAAVRFAEGIHVLHAHGCTLFLEIGPNPTLSSMGMRCLPEGAAAWLPSLRQNKNDDEQTLASLGALYCHGLAPNWEVIFNAPVRKRVKLPLYPFQRERYWIEEISRVEDRESKIVAHDARSSILDPQSSHPLLGARLRSALKEIQFESRVQTTAPDFLSDHRFHNLAVFPAAGYMEMALAAAQQIFGEGPCAVREFSILTALPLQEEQTHTLQFIATPEGESEARFQILRLAGDAEAGARAWTTHVTGKISVADIVAQSSAFNPQTVQARCTEEISGENFYQSRADLGAFVGPKFRAIEKLWRREGEALGRLQLKEALASEAKNYFTAPALLDASIQLLLACLAMNEDEPCLYLPVGFDEMELAQPLVAPLWCHAELQSSAQAGQETYTGALRWYDDRGVCLGEVKGLLLKRADDAALQRLTQQAHTQDWFYEKIWQPQALSATEHNNARASGNWLLFADRSGRGEQLAQQLRARGETCVLVYAKYDAAHEPLLPRLGRGMPLGESPDSSDDETSAQPRLEQMLLPHEAHEIDFMAPEEYDRMLHEVLARDRAPLTGLIHLWSLDAVALVNQNPEALLAAQQLTCGSVLHLVQALARIAEKTPPRLWLITEGAHALYNSPLEGGQGGVAQHHEEEKIFSTRGNTPLKRGILAQTSLWGMARVLALEHPELRTVCIDVEARGKEQGAESDEQSATSNQQRATSNQQPATNDQQPTTSIQQELLHHNDEDQIAYRNGVRYVARLVRKEQHAAQEESKLTIPSARPYRLQKSRDGVLDHLKLRPVRYARLAPHEVEIEVRATGLNFRDVLNALNMYPGEAGPLGLECSGVISAVGENVTQFQVGEEVLAMAFGSFSSHVRTHAELVVHKPQTFSFAEAATIPVTFLTAYYGMHHLAHMPRGARVLLHAAAGGVGLSAVQIAQAAGAEIFATASSPEKHAHLQALGVQHILNSRTLDFAETIMQRTNGRGVDLVLNSLTGDFIARSVEVLSPHGCFLEIGKRDIWSKEQFAQAKPHAAYHVIALDHMAQTQPELVGKIFRELMALFASNVLRPLPHRDYELSEAVAAFRYMAQAKHIGKVVVSVKQEDRGSWMVDSRSSQSLEKPRSTIDHPQSTILITGGLGGLGLSLAQWLVQRGARHLALMSRSAPSLVAEEKIEALRAQGAQVLIVRGDVALENDVARVLDEIKNSMPPLRGIIHAAGVLQDALLLQQRWENFETAMAPKVAGAWHLHNLTRETPLDFFVLFSSVVSVLGFKGQSNYAAANAFLDAFAQWRSSLGLKTLSLNWGPWAEVGMAAALSTRERRRWTAQGLQLINMEQGWEALAHALQFDAPQLGVLPINWNTYAQQRGNTTPPLLRALITKPHATTTQAEQPQISFEQHLQNTLPDKRASFILAHVREQTVKILGLPPSRRVDVSQPLREMGLDSLMTVELRNALSTTMGRALPGSLVFDYPTIAGIASFVAEKVFPAASPSSITRAKKTEEHEQQALTHVQQLSEEGAEALLAEKLAALEGRLD